MNKPDVLNFSFDIEQKLLKIHNDLKYKKYKHGNYEQFILCDPKRRIINKALVRDRIVHHSIVRILEPFYDKTFINN
jgi:retron-type reverse transcriptase